MIGNRLWKILVTFHQCGTLSAAAEKLYVSQPSLSGAMKQLEKELGVPLFERSRNHIVLNEVGLEAARLAQGLLEQEDAIIEKLQKMSRRFRTVTVPSFVSELQKAFIGRLTALYPDRSIASELLSSELLPFGLLQGQFDYVITEYPIEEPGVLCVPYVTDGLMIRLHKTDELAGRASVTFRDLENNKLLVLDDSCFWASYIRRHFAEKMQLVFVKDEHEYHDLLWAFHMRSFILATTVSQIETPTPYRYVPLAEEDNQVTFYLCCLQKNAQYLPKLLCGEKC